MMEEVVENRHSVFPFVFPGGREEGRGGSLRKELLIVLPLSIPAELGSALFAELSEVNESHRIFVLKAQSQLSALKAQRTSLYL